MAGIVNKSANISVPFAVNRQKFIDLQIFPFILAVVVSTDALGTTDAALILMIRNIGCWKRYVKAA